MDDSTCRLCGDSNVHLCKSHIVPEFLYKDLYNEKRYMLALREPNSPGRVRQMKWTGVWERLFCQSCEKHFNESFEMPFLKQWEPKPFPNRCEFFRTYHITVDYESFRLFHLSILFRASVSTNLFFEEVKLGQHESCLKSLLLSCDPGEPEQFQLAGSIVIDPKSAKILPIITRPTQFRYNSQRYFTMVYGGVEWWIKLSSHKERGFEQIILDPNGHMPLSVASGSEIPAIRQAFFTNHDSL